MQQRQLRLTGFALVCILGLLSGSAGAADQPLLTAGELDRFIRTWPRYTELESREASAPVLMERHGWQLDRFLYVAGQVAAGLVQLDADPLTAEEAPRTEERAAAILESEHLTQQQKDKLIARSRAEAVGADQSPQIPESELRLIRERREDLQRIMGLAY